jgi:hypothetical protein
VRLACTWHDIGNVQGQKKGKRPSLSKLRAFHVCRYNDTTYSYAFTVRGVAHDWASADDLKGVIEAILKEYMPKEDVSGMEVSVQVTASYNGDQEMFE